jgi:hypothetical protein
MDKHISNNLNYYFQTMSKKYENTEFVNTINKHKKNIFINVFLDKYTNIFNEEKNKISKKDIVPFSNLKSILHLNHININIKTLKVSLFFKMIQCKIFKPFIMIDQCIIDDENECKKCIPPPPPPPPPPPFFTNKKLIITKSKNNSLNKLKNKENKGFIIDKNELLNRLKNLKKSNLLT